MLLNLTAETLLFNLIPALRLEQLLTLCQHWAATADRPAAPEAARVIDQAVMLYCKYAQMTISSELPTGLVNLFEYWREQPLTEAQWSTALQADDPFKQACGMYLGHTRGWIEDSALIAAAQSSHWPLRYVAQLLLPQNLESHKSDPVIWVAVQAEVQDLLQTTIAGSADDYAWRRQRLIQTTGVLHTLLELLCLFQDMLQAHQVPPGVNTLSPALDIPVYTGSNTLGLIPLAVNPRDNSIFVQVPSGEFNMGDMTDPNNPPHSVLLSAYWISVYAVTNAQYQTFVTATGHRPPEQADYGDTFPVWQGNRFPAMKAEHPVVCVSWNDAQAYAHWAGCELASEAQWEKAARGPQAWRYPWGPVWDASRCRHGNNCGNETTCRVYDYPAGSSGYGVYNTSGNVSEWCADGYDKDYALHVSKTNPLAPVTGTGRIHRGGSWWHGHPRHFEAIGRGVYDGAFRFDSRGFRLVWNALS